MHKKCAWDGKKTKIFKSALQCGIVNVDSFPFVCFLNFP